MTEEVKNSLVSCHDLEIHYDLPEPTARGDERAGAFRASSLKLPLSRSNAAATCKATKAAPGKDPGPAVTSNIVIEVPISGSRSEMTHDFTYCMSRSDWQRPKHADRSKREPAQQPRRESSLPSRVNLTIKKSGPLL